MLRARAPRRPPNAVRRALTFWRRSIQARVVVSTVLLSAVVVSAVGWLLLQQTRDGLLENRVDEVLAEVADEVDEANQRLADAPTTDPDPTAQRRVSRRTRRATRAPRRRVAETCGRVRPGPPCSRRRAP